MLPTKRPADRLAAHVAQSLGGRLHGRQLLSRVHNMALEMLQDRGLTVVESCASEDQLLRRIDEVKHVLRALPPHDDKHGGAGPAETVVYIDAEERTGVKLVRTLRDEHGDDTNLCIINAEGATPFTKKEVADCEHVEFWQVHELLCNPTRHALVPRHVALTADETAALQRERCILPEQWPVMLSTDVICRWMRFRKGTVVRIARRGLAHEACDYFRKVE